MLSNACDGVRDGDSGQTSTYIEGITTNACDGVRDGDRGQAGTAGEGIVANACDGVRNGDRSQSSHMIAYICRNNPNIVTKGKTGNIRTGDKWTCVVTEATTTVCVEKHRGQAGTVAEGITTNACINKLLNVVF